MSSSPSEDVSEVAGGAGRELRVSLVRVVRIGARTLRIGGYGGVIYRQLVH